jgi:hypothetical protein
VLRVSEFNVYCMDGRVELRKERVKSALPCSEFPSTAEAGERIGSHYCSVGLE